MMMTMNLNHEILKQMDEDPLLRYCGGKKEFIKRERFYKLKLYPWLEKPDDVKNSDDDDDSDSEKTALEDRIIFEIEDDEKGEDPQIYELMYVLYPSSSIPFITVGFV